MTILTEEGVRKIIRKKMINEIGFRGVDPKAGQSDTIECDLSGVDQATLAVKFAKYFIFNPKIERKKGDDSEIYTKRNLLPFLTNLKDKSDLAFEKKIKQKLDRNPEFIGKYIEALELAMKLAFGPFANLYCTSIVSALGAGYTARAGEVDKEESGVAADADSTDFYDPFGLVQREFNKAERVSPNISDEYRCILFPETLKALKGSPGRPATSISHTPTSRTAYTSELNYLNTFISRHRTNNSKPQEIFADIEKDIFKSVVNKQKILTPLKDALKRILNSRENGSVMLDAITVAAVEAKDNLKP